MSLAYDSQDLNLGWDMVQIVNGPGRGGGVKMLKIGCVLAGIAGIGLIFAAVLGVAVDTAGVTTAGIIAAISAGGIAAVMWVGLVANWYQKRTAPVEEEEKPSSSEEKPKPSSSKS